MTTARAPDSTNVGASAVLQIQAANASLSSSDHSHTPTLGATVGWLRRSLDLIPLPRPAGTACVCSSASLHLSLLVAFQSCCLAVGCRHRERERDRQIGKWAHSSAGFHVPPCRLRYCFRQCHPPRAPLDHSGHHASHRATEPSSHLHSLKHARVSDCSNINSQPAAASPGKPEIRRRPSSPVRQTPQSPPCARPE